MTRQNLFGVLACAMVIGIVAVAGAGIPDLDQSYATSTTGQDVSCLVCPQGDGSALTNCYVYGQGATGNAVIHAYLNDVFGDPIEGFPAVDLWIETTTCAQGYPGIVLCTNGSIADMATDASGHTQWTSPFKAGCCGCGVRIMVSNNPLNQTPFDTYFFNSPDMNCDLTVNLTDVVLFAGYYYGTYSYCADFYWDGILNLSDIVLLAGHMQHTCP